MPRLREDPTQRVLNAVEPSGIADSLVKALSVRRVHCERGPLETTSTGRAIAFAPKEPLSPKRAKVMGNICREAALGQRPVVALVPAHFDALDEACAWAYLRAQGAVLCPNPNVWLETLVMLSCFGLPSGPKTAIVAPPGSWLAAEANQLAQEARHQGSRFSPIGPTVENVRPTDVVLVERDVFLENRSKKFATIPVVGRAELLGERPALVGLRAAISAVEIAGGHVGQVASGLGTDPDKGPSIDHDRIDNQWLKLDSIAGDHETKVFLSAAGINVTRQAVATTPSAAVGKAKKVGFPVEIKPWAASSPGEESGCPLEIEIYSAAEVRRAFAAISAAMGETEAPVIVREKPTPGRHLSVTAMNTEDLGPFVVLRVPGYGSPIASPAPLRSLEALRLAQVVASSRTGEAEPDRAGLSDLLRRLSYLISKSDSVDSIELSRIIVGAKGDQTVVVDGRTYRA